MRSVSDLTPNSANDRAKRPLARLLGAPASKADRVAIAVLAALPAIINLPFAFAGRPLMSGDDLVQNYPLRVLSGELIAHGHLPLWNPDIWSGAPLLAGWNAGAMFPGTWLFAFLPGVAAWEVNVIAVGVVAGIGMHAFLRRVGCSPVASLLGALTFTYAGFMSGQFVHIGLVMGMAFAPWLLVALEQMARATRVQGMFRPVALFAMGGGLVVLAGDPRAISNDAIISGCYVLALTWRSLHQSDAALPRIGRIIIATVSGAVLAVALSSVQWLPGLSFLHQSQRASASLSSFGAYSLTGGQLSYLISPFIFGGNGTFGLPTTNFNLPEYTYGVGILPLVALFAIGARELTRLAKRLVRRSTAARDRSEPPSIMFLALFVIGIVLSLGTTTPLGHLLVHVPLYGGERLQSRNMGITDLALCALVAIFIDRITSEVLVLARAPRTAQPPSKLERVAGALPPLLIGALVVAMFCATAATERFLGATAIRLGLPDRMAPYYALEIALAVAALVVAVRVHWRRPTLRRRLAIGVVLVDVAVFIAFASYQPAPTGTLSTSNAAVTALDRAAGTTNGRQAIFNPQQLTVARPSDALDDLGVDDLVILHDQLSVQGYGSAVSGSYEAATGAHEVENLRPEAFLGSTFDTLDLRVLATLPELFGTVRPAPTDLAVASGPPRAPGSSVADRQPGDIVDFRHVGPAGPWRLDGGSATSFELPGAQSIDRVALLISRAPAERISLDVTVVLRSGARRVEESSGTESLREVTVPAGWVDAGGGATEVTVALAPRATPPHRSVVLGAVAVHVVPWEPAPPIESDGVAPSRAWFELDGMLQGLLSPSAWHYETNDGAVLLFRNDRADGAAWLEPSGSKAVVSAARSPGTVVAEVGAAWQDPVDVVDAPDGALFVRSESYAPGWSATVVAAGPAGSAAKKGATAFTLPVVSVGLVQGVELPPGRWIVTWSYRSARAEVGLALGALATLLLIVLAVAGGTTTRRGRRSPRGDRRFGRFLSGTRSESRTAVQRRPVEGGDPL